MRASISLMYAWNSHAYENSLVAISLRGIGDAIMDTVHFRLMHSHGKQKRVFQTL